MGFPGDVSHTSGRGDEGGRERGYTTGVPGDVSHTPAGETGIPGEVAHPRDGDTVAQEGVE